MKKLLQKILDFIRKLFRMPQGLMIWDASGRVVVDNTYRCGRILGISNTGTANGSLTVGAGASTGAIFVAPLAAANYDTGTANAFPYFQVSGSTIYWTFSFFSSTTAGGSDPQINGPVNFIYGVF